eukprot:1160626-Pelagomonas_calceolata.AAC.9
MEMAQECAAAEGTLPTALNASIHYIERHASLFPLSTAVVYVGCLLNPVPVPVPVTYACNLCLYP